MMELKRWLDVHHALLTDPALYQDEEYPRVVVATHVRRSSAVRLLNALCGEQAPKVRLEYDADSNELILLELPVGKVHGIFASAIGKLMETWIDQQPSLFACGGDGKVVLQANGANVAPLGDERDPDESLLLLPRHVVNDNACERVVVDIGVSQSLRSLHQVGQIYLRHTDCISVM